LLLFLNRRTRSGF